jgi:hypothetical protein
VCGSVPDWGDVAGLLSLGCLFESFLDVPIAIGMMGEVDIDCAKIR